MCENVLHGRHIVIDCLLDYLYLQTLPEACLCGRIGVPIYFYDGQVPNCYQYSGIEPLQ